MRPRLARFLFLHNIVDQYTTMKGIIQLIAIALLAVLFTQCGSTEPKIDNKVGSDETQSSAISQDHVKVWDESVKQVIELIDYMPEGKLDFRPHDSMRTFAEQIVHISISSEMITNMFLKDIPRPEEMPEIEANTMDKDELKAFVNEKLGNARNTIESMTDEQLLSEKVTSLMGNEMTRLEGMLFATDHLTNHKAKANLYIRLAGHVPPRYRYY